jgi:hypothetical protein
MKIMRGILKFWLPLATAVILLSGLIYLVAQQSLRSGANDVQIQIAEDAAQALASGQPAAAVFAPGKIDIASSLAPFVVVYDRNGTLLASNAVLHDQSPVLPKGVLEYTFQHHQDRVTWQPESGVRIAAVVVAVPGEAGGFVLAGRSLREVENRESQLTTILMLGCLFTLGATLVMVALFEILPFTRSAG